MDFSWILGHARTTFHHSKDTIRVPLKDKDHASGSCSLLSICENVTPPCRLNPLICGGHAQTIYSAVCSADVQIHYRRKVFECTDTRYPGSFAVDFVTRDITSESRREASLHPRTTYFSDSEWHVMNSGASDTRPMLIVLHGLSGGSHELYLREALAPLFGMNSCDGSANTNGEDPWEACVINARGCARSSLTSPRIFNARATWDLRTVVEWVRSRFPNRKLFAIGFSLGANIMVNYIGEEGPKCGLSAAAACSNPWDLAAGSLNLQRSWLGREVYSRTMADNLRKNLKRQVEQLSKNPLLDMEKILNTRYLHDLDRELQCPSWGYPTEGAYYRDASSTETLLSVRIPLFCLNAEDDPVAPLETLPIQEVTQNPFAILCTTSMGGHLGWFEIGGARWFVKPIVGFLTRMANDVDLAALDSDSAKTGFEGTMSSGFDPLRRKLH